MPGDLRKISLLAIIFLVLLRISIGWHLMYEGLWKLSTQHSASPWTAEGYLKNSTGPLRSTFRDMTGDPNDLKWLDYGLMVKKWDDWRTRYVAHYQPTENQRQALDKMLDGPESFTSPLAELPPGLDLAKVSGVNKQAIHFDADEKQLVVDGKLHLLPAEQERLIAAARKIADADPSAKKVCDQFIAAINRIYKLSSKLSYKEKLEALLKQDPDRVGFIIPMKGAGKAEGDDVEEGGGGESLVVIASQVEFYKQLIARFDANYAKAKTKFEWDHIERQWKELQDKRRELVGPIQALEKELQTNAEELLTDQSLAMSDDSQDEDVSKAQAVIARQLAAGPVPEPMTPIRQINQRTMWGLTIFGLLLMLGLFTRLSAVGGAGLLMMFYLAMPPWPGVQEIPSIEHNLFVNKVSVEMVALLAIAALPSGKWFGLDAIISAIISRFTGKPRG